MLEMSCRSTNLFCDEQLLIKFIISNLQAVVAGRRCVGSAFLVRLRRGMKFSDDSAKLQLPSLG
jgi:hypothetical protein